MAAGRLIFGGADAVAGAVCFAAARAVLLPAPYDRTATYQKGSRKGPLAILKASENLELYDEELDAEPYRLGIHTAPPLRLEKLAPAVMVETVRREISRVFKAGKLPVLIGGEHSVSIGAVQAAAAQFSGLSVLALDAHADLRDEYEGSRFNHACVNRRFLENCPVTAVGVRSFSRAEGKLVEEQPAGLKVIGMRQLRSGRNWQNDALKSLADNVYVSIDLDVFDPAVMPAVGTPEPGGLLWDETVAFLKKVAAERRLVGFDVVELMPISGLVFPDFTAAKLIYKLLGHICGCAAG